VLVILYESSNFSRLHIIILLVVSEAIMGCKLVSDIAIFVLKRDVKLQLTNYGL